MLFKRTVADTRRALIMKRQEIWDRIIATISNYQEDLSIGYGETFSAVDALQMQHRDLGKYLALIDEEISGHREAVEKGTSILP